MKPTISFGCTKYYNHFICAMKTLDSINHWSETHQSIWLDFIRTILGVFLLVKGVSFTVDFDRFHTILMNSQFKWVAAGLVHYVIFSHIVGGLLIAIGLKTRVAVLFNLPILLGAVIFINAKHGFFSGQSELGISLAILILLIFFLIYGSGKYSIDKYMETHTFY